MTLVENDSVTMSAG